MKSTSEVAAADDVHEMTEAYTDRRHNRGRPEEVSSTPNSPSLKSAKQVNIDVDGKYFQNEEAAVETFESHSGGSGLCVGDQCHHPQCLMNKGKDGFLEVLLMVSSFLLSFGTAGAFYFTRALTIVGSHDPVLKHLLPALNRVFAASFFSNFVGVFVLLILQSRHEYHPYKKYSLITSNAASFLFLALGYGSLIAFNGQSR